MMKISFKIKKTTVNRKRGFALILTLLATLLLFSMAAGILKILETQKRRSLAQSESMTAYYLAESGIEYIKATTLQKVVEVNEGTEPRGIRMPSLSMYELAIACGLGRLEKTENADDKNPYDFDYYSKAPVPVKDSDGDILGHFVLKIELMRDARGSPGVKALPDPQTVDDKAPCGNSWLPVIMVESTGYLGDDPEHPLAARTVRALLVPLPPVPFETCKLPDSNIYLDENSITRYPAENEVESFLPSYGDACYQVAFFQDLGVPNSGLFAQDNSPDEPDVYPPVSENSSKPWWDARELPSSAGDLTPGRVH
ncbi:MAG: hypothetical protein J7M18_06565 [Candidatus Eremiobacteraeota bacterium]|nr:hypothetical protein [Candidatus Eremiobacteraeota bacterium]